MGGEVYEVGGCEASGEDVYILEAGFGGVVDHLLGDEATDDGVGGGGDVKEVIDVVGPG